MTSLARDLRGRTLQATFFHAPERGEIEILPDALVSVGADGRIAAVLRAGDPARERALAEARSASRLERLPEPLCVLPGFVDLHIHAPQYPQLGVALDRPLETWLQDYTFPLEARFADLAFARRAYRTLVRDLLAQGTTTAVMFGTVHLDATRLLADLCLEAGLRAVVGKVAMDDPDLCPTDYRDAGPDAAVGGTQALVEHVRGHPDNGSGLVRPAVTPRFIPACTDAALEGLGALARACGCHVQTHCSESDWEHAHVLARTGLTDTQALDGFGLLTRRSVLAHAGHVSGADMDRIGERGSGIAHCPLSNAYFANAVLPLRAALEKGLRVGLGTDISAGPSASMLDAMRMSVVASRMLEDGVDPARPAAERGRPGARIDWRTAFHLATAGGGAVLDLPVGAFRPGLHYDALVIDPTRPDGTVRLLDEVDDREALLARILHNASRPNIAAVYVDGIRRADRG